jgi:ATP:corrinoid adenosyltransferase
MDKGFVRVFCGRAGEKTALALGQAINLASQGDSVIIIQFLNEKDERKIKFIQQLEPEVKLFRFEKSEVSFEELSTEKKLEEQQNIKNGLNFAKKVLTTRECGLLVLDGILDLLEYKIICNNDLKGIIEQRSDDVGIILTGVNFQAEGFPYIDDLIKLESVKM